MTQTVTRRGLVVAASPAIIAAALPALAAGVLKSEEAPDAALLALREPYERTLAAAEAVSPAHSKAEAAVLSIMRVQPGRDRAEVEREAGFDVAKARWEAELEHNGEVIQQIVDTPAVTLKGADFQGSDL